MDLFEEEELADDTRAKLVHFEEDNDAINEGPRVRGIGRPNLLVDESEDEYYSGKPVSRDQLASDDSYDDQDSSESGMECEDQEQELEYGDGEIERDMENGDEPSEPGSHDDASGSPDTKKPFSIPDISADIAKGKAAKQQIELWERLLEVRIHLQKMLTISNRLPSHEVCPEFVEHGKQPATEAVACAEKQLGELMNKLVIAQESLLTSNPDTEHIVPNSTATSSHKQQEGIDDEYLSKMQHSLKDHCDHVITKWQDRTHLASGRVTSNKDFMKVDQSIVTQINQVMEDTPRLVKRSQLKRSQYKILGKPPGSCDLSHDAHLRDYEEEIFDDDDFYHQLLQALINGKMKLTDTSDPVAMGRQLLELQKMRKRAKKTVDTGASKGRKIREGEVHSKLVNFMTPIHHSKSDYMSDATKNELFSSLFR